MDHQQRQRPAAAAAAAGAAAAYPAVSVAPKAAASAGQAPTAAAPRTSSRIAAGAARAAAALAVARSAARPTDKGGEEEREGQSRTSSAGEAQRLFVLAAEQRFPATGHRPAELQRERGEEKRNSPLHKEGVEVGTDPRAHEEDGEDEHAETDHGNGVARVHTEEDDGGEAQKRHVLRVRRKRRLLTRKAKNVETVENSQAVQLLQHSYQRQKQPAKCQQVKYCSDCLHNSLPQKRVKRRTTDSAKKRVRPFRFSYVFSAGAPSFLSSPLPRAPGPPILSTVPPLCSPSSSSTSSSPRLPWSLHPTCCHESSSPSTLPSSPSATSGQLLSYLSSSPRSPSTRPSSSASPGYPSSSSSSSACCSSSSFVALQAFSPAAPSRASSPSSSQRSSLPAAPQPSASAALLRVAPASPSLYAHSSAVSSPAALSSFPSSSPSASFPSLSAPCMHRWRWHSSKWSATGAVRFCAGVCTWYASSLLLTASNKYLFDVLGVPLPISLTFLHFSFVSIALQLLVCCFPRVLLPFVSIPRRTALTLLLPAAACAAADVGLTNSSYSLLPISAITLVKSSSVFFTYLLSVLCRVLLDLRLWSCSSLSKCVRSSYRRSDQVTAFSQFLLSRNGLESFRMEILATVVLIMVSICLTVLELEMKNPGGVAVVSAAVLIGALRWIFIQQVLRQHRDLSVPQLLLLLQPLSSICLSPAVLFYELPPLLNAKIPDGGVIVARVECQHFLAAVLVAGCSVLTAALVLFAEVTVLDQTSPVSLCVVGVGKEVLTISMSVVIFGEILRARVLLGIVASIVGVLYYAYIRYKLAFEEVQPA